MACAPTSTAPSNAPIEFSGKSFLNPLWAMACGLEPSGVSRLDETFLDQWCSVLIRDICLHRVVLIFSGSKGAISVAADEAIRLDGELYVLNYVSRSNQPDVLYQSPTLIRVKNLSSVLWRKHFVMDEVFM